MHDGVFSRDDVGIDCENFQDVLAKATSGLADFAKEAIPGAKWQEMAIRVRDNEDRPIMQAILRLEIKSAN
jgi:hypothetical protein